MKNAVLFVIIFGLGALFYALLIHFFTPQESKETKILQQNATTTMHIETPPIEDAIVAEQEKKTPVLVTSDGSLLDGPFPLYTKAGEKTNGTVRIIRSPEETLLQFENFNEPYSPASHVYFASDLQASAYFNLGPAKMTEDHLIYGIPLDAHLENYSYVLIYQTQLDEVEYYAVIHK
jgi:hypothetical protein